MIDVHCHYYPERYTELMTRLGARNQPRFRYPTTDATDQLAARLQLMDQAGVQLQILCPASSYPYLMDYESYTETFAYIPRSDLPADDIDQIMHHSAAKLFARSALTR